MQHYVTALQQLGPNNVIYINSTTVNSGQCSYVVSE